MRLVLADGTAFEGAPFGAARATAGEVVFHTGQTGYPEMLTDPAYRGQILVLAQPLQGNYGVDRGPFESERAQVEGLVIGHLAARHHPRDGVRSLDDWLASEGVPALQGVDTRAIVRHLQVNGTMAGHLHLHDTARAGAPGSVEAAEPPSAARGLPVAPQAVRRYPAGPLWVLAIDTGIRESAVRSLVDRGVSVVRYPASGAWSEALGWVDGILLGSGPGDPAAWRSLVERITELIAADLPIFGICLGHQLLALAAGARTFKLPYGHRSANQPVLDLRTGRSYSTSQNHGYAVDPASLPPEWVPWSVNLHDGSNEGIRHRHKPFVGAQFHPEAATGPRETGFLFDEFIDAIRVARRRRGLAAS